MTENKRKHARLPSTETIFIELVSSSADGHDGEVVRCKTSDISTNGLRAQVGKELIVGAILQVGVDLQKAQDTLYLAAQVIWCKPDKNNPNSWSAGFELLNANDSDIKTGSSEFPMGKSQTMVKNVVQESFFMEIFK